MESGGRRADTGRTTKGYGGGRRAEGEKFLLRFSKALKFKNNYTKIKIVFKTNIIFVLPFKKIKINMTYYVGLWWPF